MGLYEELKNRGMIAQVTDEDAVRDLLNNEKATFYIGFDPTADSLHIGHFIQLKVMAHMQRAGHRPIAVFGGGTARVGDPSGKDSMRKMLSREEIEGNIDRFKKQMSRFIDTSDGKALFVNNGDWLNDLNYIDFLREVGPHFTVNRMLAAECYKIRMETGLTFLEFNYMIMQSYDFYRLFTDYGCKLELGGDDQWSNIIGGVELVRRKAGAEVYGLTFKLLLTSEGKKMGKTEKGALWLDPEKTSPYDFYQYFRNVADADVINCMKMLTFMNLEEIADYEKLEGADLNRAKERLAYEVTALIHGEEEAKKCEDAAKSVFGGSGSSENMPSTALPGDLFINGAVSVIDMLTVSGLAPSKGEARRLIQQGGIVVAGERVTAIDKTVDKAAFEAPDGVIVKKGKKTYHKFTV
ncbi:MAG: tyrosine--tRNA ligase [Clostridia bacterium]|nr:tyrosine--tRNA ligase [Clostridia bacterium]